MQFWAQKASGLLKFWCIARRLLLHKGQNSENSEECFTSIEEKKEVSRDGKLVLYTLQSEQS